MRLARIVVDRITRPEELSLIPDPGHHLSLQDKKKLLTIKGRSSELGAPLLYGTTKDFLQFFGLDTLKDLPSPEEL